MHEDWIEIAVWAGKGRRASYVSAAVLFQTSPSGKLGQHICCLNNTFHDILEPCFVKSRSLNVTDLVFLLRK